jgi:beta-lactamase class A
MALYADAAAGRVDLGERVEAGERVDGSGILRDLRDVGPLSLRDLAALAIGLSDNTATNRLIDRIGIERVAERLAEWGCTTTALRRQMYDFAASKRGLENVASARELASLLARLVAGECVDRATSDAVLAVMERCDDDRKLRRFLGPNVKVPSKSGTLDASRNDVAAEHLLGIIGRCAATAAGMTVPPLPFGD